MTSSQGNQTTQFEAEVIEGLETFVSRELRAIDPHIKISLERKGIIQFTSTLNPHHLLKSRTASAIYALRHFDIPRPKALLGHQYFQQMIEAIQLALKTSPASAYTTLYIDAAGSDSSVMQRIKNELAQAVKLQPSDTKGDLHIRIRKGLGKTGWDVLIRLTPRPLATRQWRIANFEGALNGTVAHIITNILLSPLTTSDTILNIACGSGSLLIERALHEQTTGMPSTHLIGVDNDPFALSCAQQNIEAALVTAHIQLLHADARQLPFPSGTFNRIIADLPFGQRIGSHDENIKLYPHILKETARIATQHAQFALVTHEKRLIQRILSDTNALWRIQHEYPINLSGLHPQIYLLTRR